MKFPQASVTLYVRIVVSVQPEMVGKLSFTKVILGVEQLSAASVTTALFGAEKVPLQPEMSIGFGFEAVGLVVSILLIVLTALPVLPQLSVTRKVRVIIIGQIPVLVS